MSAEPELKAELAALRARLSALEARLAESVESSRPKGALLVLFVEVQTLAAALPVEAVLEVVPAAKLSPLPEAPPWVLGTLNLRGTTLPVIDVAARVGRAAPELRVSDVIVVMTTERAALGLLVSEVGTIQEVELDAEPALAETPHAAYVVGTFSVGERARLLLGVRELAELIESPTSAAAEHVAP